MVEDEQLVRAAEVISGTAATVLEGYAGREDSEGLMFSVAQTLATVAHTGQRDRAGRPYITHLATVASYVTTTEEKCVAWLHDTLEDTALTEGDLRPIFGDRITDAVVAMTHTADVPYLDYVRALKHNRLAKVVKLADLRHNMDPSRQENFTEDWQIRMKTKYLPAVRILTEDTE